MKLTEMHFAEAQPVESYGHGFFKIGGHRIESGMLLTAEGAKLWGDMTTFRASLRFRGQLM